MVAVLGWGSAPERKEVEPAYRLVNIPERIRAVAAVTLPDKDLVAVPEYSTVAGSTDRMVHMVRTVDNTDRMVHTEGSTGRKVHTVGSTGRKDCK